MNLNKAINEAFDKDQLKQLKDEFSKIKKIDPMSPKYKELKKKIQSMPDDLLKQIVKEKIKFIVSIAMMELDKRKVKFDVNEESLNEYLDDYNYKEAKENFSKYLKGLEALTKKYGFFVDSFGDVSFESPSEIIGVKYYGQVKDEDIKIDVMVKSK